MTGQGKKRHCYLNIQCYNFNLEAGIQIRCPHQAKTTQSENRQGEHNDGSVLQNVCATHVDGLFSIFPVQYSNLSNATVNKSAYCGQYIQIE